MRQLLPVLFFASLLLAGVASAADGTAVGVNPQAQADNSGALRTLVVGDDIFSGERVMTGRTGQVQILFDDQTRLVVGPGSSLVIEDYLKRGDHTAGKVAIGALAGSFRFITGKSAKTAYQIKTPTGAIGVRGTAFDFNVGSQGTLVLLFHGAVTLCNTGGKCVALSKKCALGSFDGADAYVLGNSDMGMSSIRSRFPYALSQTPLMRPFRVSQAPDCVFRNDGNVDSLTPTENGTGPGDGRTTGTTTPRGTPIRGR